MPDSRWERDEQLRKAKKIFIATTSYDKWEYREAAYYRARLFENLATIDVERKMLLTLLAVQSIWDQVRRIGCRISCQLISHIVDNFQYRSQRWVVKVQHHSQADKDEASYYLNGDNPQMD